MFPKMKGPEAKLNTGQPERKHEVRELDDLKTDDLSKIRHLQNTLKKRHLFDIRNRDSWQSMDAFKENGKMFTVDEDGVMKGFLGLLISKEGEKAEIKSLRVADRNPEIMHSLLEKALLHLKDRGVHTVTLKFADDSDDDLKECEHVLVREFKFLPKNHEGNKEVLELTL